MQHTATHRNTLQHITTRDNKRIVLPYSTHSFCMQHTATHCNTLQHTATDSMMSRGIPPYSSRERPATDDQVCCRVLQCVAVFYSVLQCVAVCCRVLQCVAVRAQGLQQMIRSVLVYCNVLQCVALYYNVLQCVAS